MSCICPQESAAISLAHAAGCCQFRTLWHKLSIGFLVRHCHILILLTDCFCAQCAAGSRHNLIIDRNINY